MIDIFLLIGTKLKAMRFTTLGHFTYQPLALDFNFDVVIANATKINLSVEMVVNLLPDLKTMNLEVIYFI